ALRIWFSTAARSARICWTSLRASARAAGRPCGAAQRSRLALGAGTLLASRALARTAAAATPIDKTLPGMMGFMALLVIHVKMRPALPNIGVPLYRTIKLTMRARSRRPDAVVAVRMRRSLRISASVAVDCRGAIPVRGSPDKDRRGAGHLPGIRARTPARPD